MPPVVRNFAPPIPRNLEPTLARYFRDLEAGLRREFDTKMEGSTDNYEMLLRSPDGSVWSIKVDDTGALTSTKVAG